jgi:hypothetical protein
MSGIIKSSCRVWFETYHGAPDIIRSVLDWKDWSILVFDGLLQPHNSIPYVHIEGDSWDGSRRWLRGDGSEFSRKSAAVKRRLHVCFSYSESGIITVLKSVARIRLVKTGNPSVGVTVNYKVCISAIALYYVLLRVECISGVSPAKTPSIVRTLNTWQYFIV